MKLLPPIMQSNSRHHETCFPTPRCSFMRLASEQEKKEKKGQDIGKLLKWKARVTWGESTTPLSHVVARAVGGHIAFE